MALFSFPCDDDDDSHEPSSSPLRNPRPTKRQRTESPSSPTSVRASVLSRKRTRAQLHGLPNVTRKRRAASHLHVTSPTKRPKPPTSDTDPNPDDTDSDHDEDVLMSDIPRASRAAKRAARPTPLKNAHQNHRRAHAAQVRAHRDHLRFAAASAPASAATSTASSCFSQAPPTDERHSPVYREADTSPAPNVEEPIPEVDATARPAPPAPDGAPDAQQGGPAVQYRFLDDSHLVLHISYGQSRQVAVGVEIPPLQDQDPYM